MDAGDLVFGVNSAKRGEVYNSNHKVLITEIANGGSGGTPESEILPSAAKKAVNGSTLRGKLSGLNISERDGVGFSECSGQPLETSLKKTMRSAKKLATPAEENNFMELGMADMPDKGKGHLPSYSMNFKCAERAQKRIEFSLKLEEKIRKKELERAIMLAKLKEAEEAEIKMLRKNLVIKAKPLPSFYFEHTPIQMELQKVPERKAKSPEEGLADNTNDKATQTGFTGSSQPRFKRSPLKRSLPRFPSHSNEPVDASGNPMCLFKPPPCLGMEHETGKSTCRAKETHKMFPNYKRALR